jgi:hypothetical protein
MSCGFSLELKSKKHLSDLNFSNGGRKAILIEGDLGSLKSISFFEEKVLIVKGSHGTLRVELSKADVRDLAFKKEKKTKKIFFKVVKIGAKDEEDSQINTEYQIHSYAKFKLFEYVKTNVKIGNSIFPGVIMEYLGIPTSSSYVRTKVERGVVQ